MGQVKWEYLSKCRPSTISTDIVIAGWLKLCIIRMQAIVNVEFISHQILFEVS